MGKAKSMSGSVRGGITLFDDETFACRWFQDEDGKYKLVSEDALIVRIAGETTDENAGAVQTVINIVDYYLPGRWVEDISMTDGDLREKIKEFGTKRGTAVKIINGGQE